MESGYCRMRFENVMEELLSEKLNEVQGELDCCLCDQCRSDIIAYALNQLSPKYVNSDVGRAYARLDTLSFQFETDMLAALMAGAGMVRNHPRHAASAQ